MSIRERTIEHLMLDDPDTLWELHDEKVRGKPLMSIRHGGVSSYLGVLLQTQLDRATYWVQINHARLRRSTEKVYIPDVVVIPVALMRPTWDRPEGLDLYADPLPLVAEVWSPSGSYDVRPKIAEYQQRGDLEIWFLHPFERTLTA